MCEGHANSSERRARLLADGMTPEQILDEHPDLKLGDIHACLRFASQRVGNPILAA